MELPACQRTTLTMQRAPFGMREPKWRRWQTQTQWSWNSPPTQRKRSGFRPKNLMIWRKTDAADLEIRRFSEAMSPTGVFIALRQRISSQLDEPTLFGTENISGTLDGSRQR